MTLKNNNLPIDEKLAQFTDKFLDGDMNEISEGESELMALTTVVQRLHTAFDEEIAPNKAEEIQKKLKANWLHIPNIKKRFQPKRKTWFLWTNQRRFRTAASVAMILVLLILTPALFINTPLIAGSAGIFVQKTLLFLILGLVLAVILIWMLRKK